MKKMMYASTAKLSTLGVALVVIVWNVTEMSQVITA